MKKIVITIDGPAGAGKTTVSKMLAEKMNYNYVDTGALYRGIAYETIATGTDPEDEDALNALCENLDLKFVVTDNGSRLVSGDKDISDEIRTPEISMRASDVSAKPVVRECLLGIQKKLGEEKAVVFEGRDMGTVVFPDAEMKFYLDASIEVRAKRRFLELKEKQEISLEEVENDMRTRDVNDSSRKIAPLKPAEDAVKVDATESGVEKVIETMLSHIKSRV